MRKKHRRKLAILGLAYWFLFVSLNPWKPVYGAASGNYTDLLPIGAAGNTTVISNGSGWSLTTLAPSQTFGDALSRAPMTVFQSTSAITISNSTTQSTFTAVSGIGKVGSTTFPATWVATGRSIRITSRGFYTSSVTATSWAWDVLLGTTSIIISSGTVPGGNSTNKSFSSTALLTIATTGANGTINAYYDILAASGSVVSPLVFSTYTVSATTVDLTTQLTVNPRFYWGAQASNNSITFTNILIEFLN